MPARLLVLAALCRMAAAQCPSTPFRPLFTDTLSRLAASSPASPVYTPAEGSAAVLQSTSALPNAVIESTRRFTQDDGMRLTVRMAGSPVVGTVSALSIFDWSKPSDEIDIELLALHPVRCRSCIAPADVPGPRHAADLVDGRACADRDGLERGACDGRRSVRLCCARECTDGAASGRSRATGCLRHSTPTRSSVSPARPRGHRQTCTCVRAANDTPLTVLQTYVIEWTASSVVYTIDDVVAIRYKRTSTSAWPTGANGGLPVRLGPWVPGGDWSGGAAQWPASGSTSMTVESLRVETCGGKARLMPRKSSASSRSRSNASSSSSGAAGAELASRSIGLLVATMSLALLL